jgi:hypothetical protein
VASRFCRLTTAEATSLDAVNFDQADAGGVIFAAHNRCPVPLNEGGQNGWLVIVARRKPGRLNRCLLRILPIIVRTDQISIAIN